MKYKVTYYIHYLVVIAIVIVILGQWLIIHEMEKNYIELNDEYASSLTEKFNLLNEKDLLSNKIVKLQETITKLQEELEEQPQWTSLGTFKITAYGIDCLGCTGITKSGTIPQVGRTIAVDPTVIPLGSKVMIDENVYVAEDTGGAIQGKIIDLFYNTEQESVGYGVQYHEVYILEE